MKFLISVQKNIDPAKLDHLFESIGWRKRGSDRWKEVLSKSSFVYSVWDKDNIVGFGRILEDGVMCMFYDIGVFPVYQRKGVGTMIMEALIDQVKDKGYASIGIFAWEQNPHNIKFYEKFGFQKVPTGMELVKYMQRE